MLMCYIIHTFAQNSSLVVDCQFPGWLSSMISYSQQQTIKNIKVIGYINGTDLKFIRNLNTDLALRGIIDLEDANFVSGGESYVTYNSKQYTTQNNILTGYAFADLKSIQKVILPKSLTAFNGGMQFLNTYVDTLVINGTMEVLKISDGYNNQFWKARCIYFPEGVRELDLAYLFHSYSKLTNQEIFFPSTLESITGNNAATSNQNIVFHCSSMKPENIKVIGYTNNNYSFFDGGTIYVPKGTTNNYRNSIFRKLTIIEETTPDYNDIETKELQDKEPYTSKQNNIYNMVNYIRNFTNTKWQALYIPFSMNYSDWADEFDIARINDVHQYDDDDNGSIDRTGLEVIKIKSGYIEANTPYLIRAKKIGEKTITVENTTLYKADENTFNVSSWNTIFTFKGSYHIIPGTEMYSKRYYALGGGSLVQAESEDSSLGAFRWYMSVTDRDGNPKEDINEVKIRVLDGDWEDDETGVVSVENTVSNNDAAVFDMSGRKVNEKDLRKGIYVKNGRKFMVK